MVGAPFFWAGGRGLKSYINSCNVYLNHTSIKAIVNLN